MIDLRTDKENNDCYTVEGFCFNCKHRTIGKFNFGESIKKHKFGGRFKCPNCGCEELSFG